MAKEKKEMIPAHAITMLKNLKIAQKRYMPNDRQKAKNAILEKMSFIFFM